MSPTWCRHLQSSVTAPRSFHDLVSRTAMLSELMDMVEGDRLLPFVRLFFSDPWMTKLETPTRSGKEREENKEMR